MHHNTARKPTIPRLNMNHFPSDVYVGLTGIEPDFDTLSLGHGVVLRKTYAHLMAHFVVAFKPADKGKHHPGPWLPATGGVTLDVGAELLVSQTFNKAPITTIDVATTIVALLRLNVNPSITFAAVANISFSEAATQKDGVSVRLHAHETSQRHFPLESPNGPRVTEQRLKWVADHWHKTLELRKLNPEFSLCIDALDSAQFVQNPSLVLVSLWGALESLFSPDKAPELSFRVSSFIASYLEEAGSARLKLQKEVKKLYNHRSKAAHGSGASDTQAVVDTFNLLRRVITLMITTNHVPNKDDLECCLFGNPDTDED